MSARQICPNCLKSKDASSFRRGICDSCRRKGCNFAGKMPLAACKSLPGSESKITKMRNRAGGGFAIFHPDDARDSDASRGTHVRPPGARAKSWHRPGWIWPDSPRPSRKQILKAILESSEALDAVLSPPDPLEME